MGAVNEVHGQVVDGRAIQVKFSDEKKRRKEEIEPLTLYVGRLSNDTDERELFNVFGPYGTITDATVTLDRDTKLSKGYAFVTFEDKEDAYDAMDALQGVKLDGNRIRIGLSSQNLPGKGECAFFESRRGRKLDPPL